MSGDQPDDLHFTIFDDQAKCNFQYFPAREGPNGLKYTSGMWEHYLQRKIPGSSTVDTRKVSCEWPVLCRNQLTNMEK